MTTQTYFTLAEYKQNYDRLRDEFIDAYVDNEEEEFISLQIEWYQRCSENTKLAWGLVGDSIGWYPKILENGNGLIWEVDEKIRNKDGEIDQTAAQNLSVSFGKIIRFLLQKKEPKVELTQGQLALYYYILHEKKLVPRFQKKVKEIEELATQYNLGPKNFQLKYNEISKAKGQEGYSKVDVDIVRQLLEKNYPSALDFLEELTQNIY